jgi:hypothetical protein
MNSKILLVKNINIDKEYTNVLSYTEAQMLELCQANLVAEADNYSFLRTTRSIMAGFTYAQCLQANYIAFQNPDYSNKWFFAWIDDVIYKGDKNTEITFTIDAWSTWFDYWQKKVCFINRQHVNDDTIGLHTVPENLDVGEVVQESFDEVTFQTESDEPNFYFAINSTYNPITKKDFNGVQKVNGILQGNWIFIFSPSNVGITWINNFLSDVNNDKKIESIKEIYILPRFLVDAIGKEQLHKDSTFGNYYCYLLKQSDKQIDLPFTIEKTTSFKNYQPKNNKCFVYPFNYLLASNNIGNNIIYKYENFNGGNSIVLDAELSVSIGASGRLVPFDYKGIDKNYNETIPLAKFPTCSWSSDAFINWLTANAVNISSNIVSTGASVATGNIGTVAGNIAGLIGQFYQASLLPSITGGNNSGDVNFSSGKNTFVIYHMRAKTEYLKIIDDYFTRFGYAIKKLEMPNIVGRKYWNYVEIGASEEIGYGDVPNKFMEIINNACRRGITIWHNHANVGNYSLNNEII